MDKTKQARLEAMGWAVSDTPDFLELAPEQIELIDLKISLGEAVRARRESLGLSQVELAKKLSTSQPRLVKMEQGAASLDSLVRALILLNARAEAGRIVGAKPPPAAFLKRKLTTV